MKALIALAVLASCGDNVPGFDDAHSGSRLKLAWYEYPDGTRVLERGWYYDSALGERCTPAKWSDGQRYCKPPTDDAVYVTNTCTRSLGRTADGAAPAPFFAISFHLQERALPSRVFRRGAATLVPPAVWEKHADGCVGPLQAAGFDYFELGDELTDLVRLRRGEPRGGDTLAIVDEISDDGLRIPVAFADPATGETCTPAARANAETVECAPDNAALASYFHEVSCLEPELASTESSPPAIAKSYSELTRCWRYFDVGDEVAAPPLYAALGGTCTSVSPPGGARFFAMSGPHATQGLIREREATTRRLARIDLVRDTLRVPDPLLFDRELATECQADAQRRCVPVTSADVMPFFLDPGCAIPLDLALVPAGECDVWVPYARSADAFHPLVVEFTDTIYWLSTGDTCATYVPPLPFVAWTIGPPIDPATFATAELVIDP